MPSEYKDDSQVIPRSSSVVVKRMPSQRPGKGKAAMYIAGTNGSTSVPISETVQRPGGSSAWHKGAMSKRFDVKEEYTASPLVRSCSKMNAPLANRRVLQFPQSSTASVPKNSVTKEDEAAAMAAMFQAQTANWEETQEKMSQLVSRLRGSSALCSRMKSHNMTFVLPFD
jgi:protein MPE1